MDIVVGLEGDQFVVNGYELMAGWVVEQNDIAVEVLRVVLDCLPSAEVVDGGPGNGRPSVVQHPVKSTAAAGFGPTLGLYGHLHGVGVDETRVVGLELKIQ